MYGCTAACPVRRMPVHRMPHGGVGGWVRVGWDGWGVILKHGMLHVLGVAVLCRLTHSYVTLSSVCVCFMHLC